MHRGRVILLVATATAAAALLFPFFTAVTIGDVREGVHLLPLACLAMAALVALAGDRGDSIAGLPAVAIAAAVTTAIIVTGAIAIDAVVATRDARELGIEASVGTGLWLTTIAAALSVFALGIGMSRRLS